MATSQRAPLAKGSFQCPVCRARNTDCGCRNARECIDAMAGIEMESTRETVAALAQRSRSKAARVLEAGFDALSSLHIGLVVCGVTGEVLGTNQTAEVILETRDGLERSPDGLLCAIPEDGQPLAEIVQQVAAGTYLGRFERNDAVLSIRRGARRRPLTVLVRANEAAVTEPAVTEAAVLVMILDSALSVRAIGSELRQLYGFTSTEARLANLLMEGGALEDCCQELGISRSTGCTHLRRIFKKTRVHRQSELVALLLKGIGLACLGSQRSDLELRERSAPFGVSERKSPRVEASRALSAS
jgi:DNA-binding CsgD family transcriptional regulator